MQKISRKQALNRWDILPDNLKEALFSEYNSKTLWKICEDQHLLEDKIYIIATLAGDVILGFIHFEDIASEIRKEVNIAPEITNVITSEINQKIFSPIKNDLEKVYSPIIETDKREFSEKLEINKRKEVELPKIIEQEIQFSEIEQRQKTEPFMADKTEPLATKEVEPMILHEETKFKPSSEISETKKSLKPLNGLFGLLRKREKPEQPKPVKAEIEGIDIKTDARGFTENRNGLARNVSIDIKTDKREISEDKSALARKELEADWREKIESEKESAYNEKLETDDKKQEMKNKKAVQFHSPQNETKIKIVNYKEIPEMEKIKDGKLEMSDGIKSAQLEKIKSEFPKIIEQKTQFPVPKIEQSSKIEISEMEETEKAGIIIPKTEIQLKEPELLAENRPQKIKIEKTQFKEASFPKIGIPDKKNKIHFPKKRKFFDGNFFGFLRKRKIKTDKYESGIIETDLRGKTEPPILIIEDKPQTKKIEEIKKPDETPKEEAIDLRIFEIRKETEK